ncbi:MAG TPA: ATP-dependent DNA ligase [Candidatus Nanoarchaeia archaeon]|nr:ATP-dependent DNA ligase [Candidatus Nanoarchaeia archaeon]
MQYSELVGVYERLEATTKRLEKTFILSEFLKNVPAEELEQVLLLVQGKVFPDWDQRVIGMAARLLLKSLNLATGASVEKIESSWKESGDLGTVAFELTKSKSQATLFSKSLTVKKVFDNLQKLAGLEGAGTVDRKVQLVAELLTSAKPKEAKYVLRAILGELRVGLGEGTVRDAIVWAFFADKCGIKYDSATNEIEYDKEKYSDYSSLVQEAYDVANDFSIVARLARSGESALQNISLTSGKPVKVMLFQKAKDVADAFSIVGKPAAFEYKYDGFRMQIHKHNGKITLFTRRLENVTEQFPDVVSRIAKNVKGNEFIIDAEVVGIDLKTRKYLPFQNISQRIKRKYDIDEMSRKFPVEVNVFDILFCDGKSLLKLPFIDRRKLLEGMVANVPFEVKLAEELITDDVSAAEDFYKASLEAGNEGVMAKNLQGIYKPGSRVGFGVKVKPTMDTLETVIVGAEWGEGKRGKWLSSFIIAVRDPETNGFVEIGRVGTGIKEKVEGGVSFEQLTQLLQPLIIEEKGKEVRVRPEVVIEVDYEEIQKSPTYSSGFALRFPRLVKLRSDRSAEDINTVDDVRELADTQRNRGDLK